MAALAAPAWGQSDDVTLRRDGSQAVPIVAQVGTASEQSDDLTLRRDPSKAVPIVAQAGPASEHERTASELSQFTAPTPSVESSGFDWGDAAIGAGLGAIAALLGVGAVGAVRHRSTTRDASAAAAR